VLGEGLSESQSALLAVALDFNAWRSLSRSYQPAEAAALMSDAVVGLRN
jgi:hypothetical protein